MQAHTHHTSSSFGPQYVGLAHGLGQQILGSLAVVWLTSLPIIAQAETYPIKPVRIVVAFSAGGTTDILARSVGQRLSERLKQPFVIDNKPGGGGTSAPNLSCGRRRTATP